MRIFDSDGAPLSYQHLGRLAPEPPAEHELIQDLIDAYHLRDADTLDFDMEETA